MTEGMTRKQVEFYEAGRKARADGRSVEACSALNPALMSFFRAGWHDKDYELGVRIYAGPERTITEERAA